MGSFLYFTETTLLYIVAVFFVMGLVYRSLVFIFNIYRRRQFSRYKLWHRFFTLFGIFIPFHRAILKRAVYAFIRYAFHACLIIVPIWFSGHIYLWEESRFGWYWTPLPDVWADWMTLFVIAVCIFFVGRRIVFKNRLNVKISDFVFILFSGLPFLSGYFLKHGNLDNIPFFENYLWYVHVISGEIMLIMIVFLFCRTRLREADCVGCAACVENCPTETLEYDDKDALRFFRYSHYQCICCGSCVNVCPEQAAELRHEMRPTHLFQIASKGEIRRVELATCDQCGIRFAPTLQINKLTRSLNQNDIELNTLNICNRCKKLLSGSTAKELFHTGPRNLNLVRDNNFQEGLEKAKTI
jgi:ferredoxin